MLVWLDSSKNRKRAPNENYARELMELFSMGVGTFSEMDVREAARAFTGWFVNSEGFVFRANQHDNGVKVFLDTQGKLDGDDVVDVIMRQPVTGDYMARRLFTYFVHDDPDPEDVAALAGVFRQSGYSIKAMMRHILTSEEFYSARAYRAQVKSPVDLVAGAVRSLGAETTGTAAEQDGGADGADALQSTGRGGLARGGGMDQQHHADTAAELRPHPLDGPQPAVVGYGAAVHLRRARRPAAGRGSLHQPLPGRADA